MEILLCSQKKKLQVNASGRVVRVATDSAIRITDKKVPFWLTGNTLYWNQEIYPAAKVMSINLETGQTGYFADSIRSRDGTGFTKPISNIIHIIQGVDGSYITYGDYKLNLGTKQITTSLNPFNSSVYLCYMGVSNNKIYIVPGSEGYSMGAGPNDLIVYDPATDTLSKLATTGGPGKFIDSGSCCLLGNLFYITGNDKELYSLNIETLKWTKLAFMPRSTEFVNNLVHINGNLHIYGGVNPDKPQGNNFINTLLSYNIQSNSWIETEVAGYNKHLVYHIQIAYNDKLYLWGGYDFTQSEPSLELVEITFK